jgi:hypothetical protein
MLLEPGPNALLTNVNRIDAPHRRRQPLYCPEKKVHHPANRSAREAERGEAESVSN